MNWYKLVKLAQSLEDAWITPDGSFAPVPYEEHWGYAAKIAITATNPVHALIVNGYIRVKMGSGYGSLEELNFGMLNGRRPSGGQLTIMKNMAKQLFASSREISKTKVRIDYWNPYNDAKPFKAEILTQDQWEAEFGK